MGTQRGRLGETVLFRSAGEQHQRAYIAHPSNPQSGSQQLQRMIVASVSQAYSGMSAICDHSFENVPTGLRSMSYFLAQNIGAYRRSITPIGSDVSFTKEWTFCSKGCNTIPSAPFIIARGSLPVVPFINFRNADLGDWEDFTEVQRRNFVMFPLDTADGTSVHTENILHRALKDNGFKSGDFLTLCFVVRTNNLIGDMDEQRFHYARFTVLGGPRADDALTLVLTASSLGVSFPLQRQYSIFGLQQILPIIYDQAYIGAFFDMQEILGYSNKCTIVLGGWIHSRPMQGNKFLRSNCDLVYNTYIRLDVDTSFIYENNDGYDAYPTWQNITETLGETQYILNGGSE